MMLKNVYHKLRHAAYRIRRRVLGLRSEELVAHGKRCLTLPTRYVWGGLGSILTPELIEEKKRMYPDHYDEEKCRSLLEDCGKGVWAFDCSGLVKNFLMGGPDHFRYNPAMDRNAKGMLDAADQKGTMDTLPELPGLCLYMEGHMGIYAGNGTVIEATANPAFGDGVVETKVSDRDWLMWFTCPGIRYGR